MRWTALIPLIGLMFLLFVKSISSTYLKSLLLQACDRLVLRLFSANSKSSRADLISTLPRIIAISPWFFNNPPAASCGPFPWQLSKKFLIFFFNIQIPLRIQQNFRSNSGFYIGTGNRRRIRAWQWHNNASSSSILILTSEHNVQTTDRVFRPVI